MSIREPADDDIQFSRSRVISAKDGNPNLGRTERLLPILGIKETARTSHFDPRRRQGMNESSNTPD
jgi:hypothetical protein